MKNQRNRRKVALVQNQSEMAHYGYADSQALIERLGYSVSLFTSSNIESLPRFLATDADALVFASNSLSDKSTREFIESSTGFGEAMDDFLLRGKGVLSFHQLGVAASDRGLFEKLFSPRCELTPRVRTLAEKSRDGVLAFPEASKAHTLLIYPTILNPEDIRASLLAFRSLSGLYWHYWDPPSLAEWDVLIHDASTSPPRPLLLASKQSAPHRVVLSSLTLDWQRYEPALRNILSYVVESRHDTAFLTDAAHRSTSFDFMLSSLEATKFPFAEYEVPHGTGDLRSHIQDSVHSTLVLGPHVTMDRLDKKTRTAIEDSMAAGRLRLIDVIEPDDGSAGNFTVTNELVYSLDLLQHTELLVQAELRRGYVDGSFWSTAETLRTLQGLGTASVDYRSLVGPSLAKVEEHDRDGSYDEVFGASCAALWLRSTYLGPANDKTQATAQWIRKNVARYEDRERSLAYWTLAVTNLASESERDELRQVLSGLNIDSLSPIDAVAYLRASLAVAHWPSSVRLLEAYAMGYRDDDWIDLATAAEGASVCIDSIKSLEEATVAVPPNVRAAVDQAVFSAVIRIQSSLVANEGSEAAYPWDGKASTAAKCLEAWTKFDGLHRLPVYDLAEVLRASSQMTARRADGRQALSVLEDLKKELESRHTELGEARAAADILNRQLTRFGRIRSMRWYLGVALALVIYIVLTLGVASVSLGVDVLALFRAGFVVPWGFHLGVAGVIATSAAGPWVYERIRGRE